MSALRQEIYNAIQRNAEYNGGINKGRYNGCKEFLREKLIMSGISNMPKLKNFDPSDEQWLNKLSDVFLLEYYERVVVATYKQM
jgi:hypothetical protein